MEESTGFERLEAAQALIPKAEGAPQSEAGHLDLTFLHDVPEIVPGENSYHIGRDVLKALGVIRTWRGQGGPATLEEGGAEFAAVVAQAARSVWSALCAADEHRVTAEEIEAIVAQHGDAFAHYDSVVLLLKTLSLAAGVRRVGGLQLYEQLAEQAAEAIKELESLDEKDSEAEQAETEHESVYYDPVADVLRKMDFEVSVLGVRQRGTGQWSTPDVVGFYVKSAPSLLVPIVRIATVEVKHILNRLAIAEAVAHKRFGHYAYVAVPTPVPDLDPELVTECVAQNIGLICPRQRSSLTFYVHFNPPLDRPDEENVEVLLQGFEDEDGERLGDKVFRSAREAMAVLFRP